VTNARLAGLAVVMARAGEKIAAFLVPTDTPGYEVTGRETTMGLRPIEVSTVELRELRLGADALLGDPARGLAYAFEGLDTGRLGIAAQATGIARAALEYAIGYADEREQFGTKIREFEAIQFKLAEMATRVEASRALVRWAATSPSTKASSMAKLFASETAMWVTTEAVQIYGGYGYMRDDPVEKLMRDAKATEIYEGTSEIQRLIIARELYRG
jgi:alkylation response protein AidB-like acyl-CoA dehydrogenase